MTPQMKATLDYLRSYKAENGGVAPTFDEIQVWLGLASKSGVYRIICQLEKRGYIRRRLGHARSIELVEGPSREEMERWSDAEVRRVTLDLYEIGRARGLGRRVAA